MNKETREEAAQRLYPIELEDDGWDKNKQYRDEWIEGAKWQQERMYSEEEVEKQKLQFAIEQLNKLDSVLQSKYEILSNMQQEYLGKMKEGQLASKKSGLRLAKEEIRRAIS